MVARQIKPAVGTFRSEQLIAGHQVNGAIYLFAKIDGGISLPGRVIIEEALIIVVGLVFNSHRVFSFSFGERLR